MSCSELSGKPLPGEYSDTETVAKLLHCPWNIPTTQVSKTQETMISTYCCSWDIDSLSALYSEPAWVETPRIWVILLSFGDWEPHRYWMSRRVQEVFVIANLVALLKLVRPFHPLLYPLSEPRKWFCQKLHLSCGCTAWTSPSDSGR